MDDFLRSQLVAGAFDGDVIFALLLREEIADFH